MLLYTRPLEPEEFSTETAVVKKINETHIRQNKDLHFPNKWGKYKNYFIIAQHKKCGYCEELISGDYGDMEHYRPKGEVTVLSNNPNEWGEHSSNNTVSQRVFTSRYSQGYWWLAYEWNNYLLSCRSCNQKYKISLFPIQENRRNNPQKQDEETPSLLNPFEVENPVNHLEYDKIGAIKPHLKSLQGLETIKTCGLDRPSLVSARFEVSEFIFRKLRSLKSTNENNYDNILFDIYKKGSATYAFAGMVRILFEQNTEHTWNDLEEYFK